MVALTSGNSWLFVSVVALTLRWIAWLALALLTKVLSSPEREVSVKIRVIPWPQIEIEARHRRRSGHPVQRE